MEENRENIPNFIDLVLDLGKTDNLKLLQSYILTNRKLF